MELRMHIRVCFVRHLYSFINSRFDEFQTEANTNTVYFVTVARWIGYNFQTSSYVRQWILISLNLGPFFSSGRLKSGKIYAAILHQIGVRRARNSETTEGNNISDGK